MTLEQAIVRALEERVKPIVASELARAALAYLDDYSLREVNSAVWRMVDERKLVWRLDRRIQLPAVS